MTDTKYHVGDIVTVRNDLAEHIRYYMDNGTERDYDTFIPEMSDFRGKLCEITEITKYGTYRIKGSFQNWTDGMFVEKEPEELPDPESLCLLYDFIA